MGVQINGPTPAQSIAQPSTTKAPVTATPTKKPDPKTEVKPDAPKTSELAKVVATIKKEYGEKSIVLGSQIPNPERLPSGVFEFDLAMAGGWPMNRYSILYGPESSGKSNLVYKTIATTQRRKGNCNKAVLVDLEGTYTYEWGAQFGIDNDSLIVSKPSFGEQAVDMIDALIRADDVALLVVDSIAVLVAAKELDGSVEKADVGTAALLIKRLANKLAVALSEEQKRGHNVAVVLLNQTRFKIGVMFGNPETQPGGQTVRFNASLILRISGKNKNVTAISSQVPAFKETEIVVKKAKVGIVSQSFNYDMCVLEHSGLSVGETDSFSQVKQHLQGSGHLKQVKGGWEIFGKVYPTLALLHDTYQAEQEFAQAMHDIVVQSHSLNLSLVAPAPDISEPPSGLMNFGMTPGAVAGAPDSGAANG